MTWDKGGWVSKLVNPAWAGEGGCRTPTEHSDKVSGLLRHSLLRNQILNLISGGFYLASSGEIIGLMSLRVLSGDLQSSHGLYWNFFLPVFLLFPFWMSGAPMGRIFRGKSLLDPPGEIQAYPFPCKINFSNFYCLLNPSWSQMGRGREVSFNSSKSFFSLKYFPVVGLKNLKQIKLY